MALFSQLSLEFTGILPEYIQKMTIIGSKYSLPSSLPCFKKNTNFFIHINSSGLEQLKPSCDSSFMRLSDHFHSNDLKYNGKQKSLELCHWQMQHPAHCRTLQEQLPWKGNALSAEFILVKQRSGWLFSFSESTNQCLRARHTQPRNVAKKGDKRKVEAQ